MAKRKSVTEAIGLFEERHSLGHVFFLTSYPCISSGTTVCLDWYNLPRGVFSSRR